MIRLSISEQSEKFREELKTWLSKHPPVKSASDSSLEIFERVGREWQKKLASGNWVGVHWPKEYGGRGLSLIEEAIVQEELVRVQAPQLLGLFGLTMVGPVLIQYGNEQQKKRFLPKILNADEVWCQGFSETTAGSDLAGLKTKATRVDDKRGKGFLLNGSKIWTSFAHVANWCFVLCKSLDKPRPYESMSYLLVDMKTPGITVRPLKQITGDDEFNEVFFDDVFVPEENLVGQEGQGWTIAVSTLMYERVVLTFSRQLQSETLLRELLSRDLNEFSEKDKADLGKEIATFCSVRALSYSHLEEYSEGKNPGPEGSLDKLYWSESFQSLSKLALRLEGRNGIQSEKDNNSVHRWLYSRGRTIAAGSSEIQRNIIAERLLGLPRLKYSYQK